MENLKLKISGIGSYESTAKLAGELGYRTAGLSCSWSNWLFLKKDGEAYNRVLNPSEHTEISIERLKDMVVLHRNDVKDGNHNHRDGSVYYITHDDSFYVFDGTSWVKSVIETSEHLIKIDQEPEQGLISGADALRALADGKEVEVYMEIPNKLPKTKCWVDASVCSLVAFAFISPNLSFKFRLKPRTITLSLEIPAPFEPNKGDKYWHLYPESRYGYDFNVMGFDDDEWLSLGAWDSEEKIKQVATAWKSAING